MYRAIPVDFGNEICLIDYQTISLELSRLKKKPIDADSIGFITFNYTQKEPGHQYYFFTWQPLHLNGASPPSCRFTSL